VIRGWEFKYADKHDTDEYSDIRKAEVNCKETFAATGLGSGVHDKIPTWDSQIVLGDEWWMSIDFSIVQR
jgi:hypothetical protein